MDLTADRHHLAGGWDHLALDRTHATHLPVATDRRVDRGALPSAAEDRPAARVP